MLWFGPVLSRLQPSKKEIINKNTDLSFVDLWRYFQQQKKKKDRIGRADQKVVKNVRLLPIMRT